jgi:hypothetical protein
MCSDDDYAINPLNSLRIQSAKAGEECIETCSEATKVTPLRGRETGPVGLKYAPAQPVQPFLSPFVLRPSTFHVYPLYPLLLVLLSLLSALYE